MLSWHSSNSTKREGRVLVLNLKLYKQKDFCVYMQIRGECMHALTSSDSEEGGLEQVWLNKYIP